MILFLTVFLNNHLKAILVLSIYEFKTDKFNVYVYVFISIYKVLDCYELILSFLRVQMRHKRADEKCTLYFQVDSKMYT